MYQSLSLYPIWTGYPRKSVFSDYYNYNLMFKGEDILSEHLETCEALSRLKGNYFFIQNKMDTLKLNRSFILGSISSSYS